MPPNSIEGRSSGQSSLFDGNWSWAKRNSDMVLADDDLIVKPAVGQNRPAWALYRFWLDSV
jgi:hypothetical protein